MSKPKTKSSPQKQSMGDSSLRWRDLRCLVILVFALFYSLSFKQPITHLTITHNHQADHHQENDIFEHEHAHDSDQASENGDATEAQEESSEHSHSHTIMITASPIQTVPTINALLNLDTPASSFLICKIQLPPKDPILGSLFRPPISA